MSGPKPLRIGLTGGIGSGKSSVAKIFASLSGDEFGQILVMDADEIARQVRREGGVAHTQILARFQTVDRIALRRILASSPEAKRDLEGILHPLIKEESDRRIEAAIRANPGLRVIVYEATLLLEAGRKPDFDRILVVTAPVSDRIHRVAVRDRIPEIDAFALIQAQNNDAYRIAQADFVIQNNGSEEALHASVRKILAQAMGA